MAEVEEKKPEEYQEKPVESMASTENEQVATAENKSSPVEQPVDVANQAAEPQMPSRGKMVAIAIVVLLLALGAVVAGIVSGRRARLARQEEREQLIMPTPTPTEEEDTLTVSYEQLSDSDEIADIESDLNATSFEGIDAELSDIDSELSAED
jgi:uncharacterized protein HemX